MPKPDKFACPAEYVSVATPIPTGSSYDLTRIPNEPAVFTRRWRLGLESSDMTWAKLPDLGRAHPGVPNIDIVLGFLAGTAYELFVAFTGYQGVVCL